VHVRGWEVKQQRWDRDKEKEIEEEKQETVRGRTSNKKESSGERRDGVGDSTR
jgi:hypothetical protein